MHSYAFVAENATKQDVERFPSVKTAPGDKPHKNQ